MPNAARNVYGILIRRGLALGLPLVALLVFFWPAAIVLRATSDDGFGGPTPSPMVYEWHRALSSSMAAWARERVHVQAGARLSTSDLSGTEWPLYGAVFYLRATENLQQAWALDPQGPAPRQQAAEAIEAAAALIADPSHASWVIQHWGASYLDRENLFYRMLLIDGLAAHRALTGSDRYRRLLSSQADSLARELDASPDGLLDDYPGQCYPVDVISAWGAIAHADRVLGSDHAQLIARGLRGFIAPRESAQALPPYFVDRRDGSGSTSRGSTNSGLLIASAWLWPEPSRRWYAAHERVYWQRGTWLAGFREFPPWQGDGLYVDVDSGPVIAGLGTAASGLGVAASRSLGRFDHARPLALEMIAVAWPLPNGRLAVPRLVSDGEHAPYMAESVILFALSQPMAPGFSAAPPGTTPGIVWAMVIFQVLGGVVLIGIARRLWRR